MNDTDICIEQPEVTERVSRVETMRAVLRAYIGHSRDQLLESELDRLIESCELSCSIDDDHSSRVGRLAEGRILAVTGKPGAGKTRSLERIFRLRASAWGAPCNHEGSQLVSVKAPSPCTLRQLGHTLLKQLGYRVERDLRENVVWDMVRDRLKLCNVRYVHIDEIQHAVDTANVNEVQKVRDTLKGLLQQSDWPVWLILSGKPSFASFIENDTQLKRRSRFVHFGDLHLETDGQFLAKAVRGIITKIAKMELDAPLDQPFVARLIHAAGGQLGIAIEFVQDAIQEALQDQATAVSLAHFAQAYEARSGCTADRNVFTAEVWHHIDVSMALQDAHNDAHSADPAPMKEKKVRDRRNK
ncbi:TniB protein [Mycoplana dimorpha]|uniref:TniB protein n=2 Tax=Mycoplana dimorpha TaxID=28320 RepID=A0A2T5BJ86_MYCDI|nr:TniB protein [Mycoplana dimorpha]